jgi:predicted nucleotidyltransferase
MKRDEALQRLRASRARLDAFPIERLAVFGSVARGEAGEGSDVDILVEFEPGARVGLFEFARLQRTLGEILGCKVDLVTPDALRQEMRAQILQEAVYAA